MKVPFSWLKDYVNVGGMKPEEVAEKLTLAGLEVVLIEKIGADSIFDIEVTPNRPDCLSILGVAREVSAVLHKKLKAPKAKPVKKKTKKTPSIEIKDKKLCTRYTGRIMTNIKVGPSPRWLAQRMEKMDLRPVNNIVDITNYCLFESGQPTHAFDYDKIKGKVIIRRAQKGEKMVTIDGKERTLDADMLVIADEEKPIALGGVMGSKDTEVTASTENILFESAYFDPVSVRKTSRRLGLISESSYRFERSVDLGGVAGASGRACSLIAELCGGEAGPLVDIGRKDPEPAKIHLRPERLKRLLGLDITFSTVKKILSSLGLGVVSSGKTGIAASVPSFRQDLKGEVDLIEEVIRIYGYDKLPSTMPTIVGHPRRVEPPKELSDIARDVLVSLGADEVITYSLISREDLKSVEDVDEDKIIVIKNPLSIEQEIMRPTIAPGILETISWNLNRGTKDIKIFELGKIYHKGAKGFKEEEYLSAAFAGDIHYLRDEEHPFFKMKGMLEALFARLGIERVLFKNEGPPDFLAGERASIEVSGEAVGFLGRVKKEVLDRFDIETDGVFLCEISLEKLFRHVNLVKRYREMPKFPSAARHITVEFAEGAITHQEIISVIKEAGGELVSGVELIDQFRREEMVIKRIKRLTYSVEYRAKNRTLTDNEIREVHNKTCEALRRRPEVRIIGIDEPLL